MLLKIPNVKLIFLRIIPLKGGFRKTHNSTWKLMAQGMVNGSSKAYLIILVTDYHCVTMICVIQEPPSKFSSSLTIAHLGSKFSQCIIIRKPRTTECSVVVHEWVRETKQAEDSCVTNNCNVSGPPSPWTENREW